MGRPLFPSDEAGRRGGGIALWSALKKLDLLLPFPAGEEGSCDRLSMVRSDRDGLAFLAAGFAGSASLSGMHSDSFSRKPAREDAREAERKALKSPRTSSP